MRLAIGTGGIGQLVAVAVQLEHDAKGVFDIDHAIGFIIGEVFAHRHPLLATCRDNLGQQVFEVGILNGEMERAVLAEIQRVCGRVVAVKFKQLDPDTVCRGKMRDTQAAPAFAKDIGTHLPDIAAVFDNLCRLHDDVEPQHVDVEFYGLVQIRHGKPDMRETAWCRCHGLSFVL
ncbi:hypothetical protein NAS141_16539 [Sulfitobacter sp. NAS-14.1]|nr:hypothetical protein NAS141_16539 [Sulfitobacter sp. NAS-14.1]